MGRPTLVKGPLRALVRRAGGVAELEHALGVSKGCVLRWSRGQCPRVAQRRRANAWAEARGLPPPFPLPPIETLVRQLLGEG